MIAGRLHWRPAGARPPGRVGLAAFDFPDGTLILTEAGTAARARSTWCAARRACRPRPRRPRRPRRRAAAFRAALRRRAAHAQARAHRPPPLQRHRQRLLRRDPAPCSPVSGADDGSAERRGARAASRRGARGAHRVDRAALGGGASRVSRRRSPPSGREWPSTGGTASPARSAARRSSASSTPRTRRTTARPARPAGGSWPTAPVTAAQRGLAAHAGGAGGGPPPAPDGAGRAEARPLRPASGSPDETGGPGGDPRRRIPVGCSA